jgi:bifunctional DNA-binding transcriptional regulator/antitoxin component of YhaV-PrlF toxin-antitoxin module
MGFKASTRRAMGEKQKGKVIIDRRTREAKATAMRLEKAKAKREEKKKAREFAEKYPKIDYNYAEASELNKIIAKSNTDIMGETAANAVSAGGIDMAPNKGSKKKKKLMAKRGY